MSRLVLVRHGETIWHTENRYAGRTDVALTEKGISQAESLAAWACNAKLDSVWSSPLSRARLTALLAANAAALPLQIDERLLELDFGRGEGKTNAEMYSEFPEERALFVLNPAMHFLPGGEDPIDAAKRGIVALRAIARADGPNGRALVVAHSTLLRLLLCSLLGIPLARYRSVFPSFANCSMTEIEITEANVGLLSFNVPFPKIEKEYNEHA